MPIGVGIAIDKVLGIALAVLNAAGEGHRDGNAVEFVEILRENGTVQISAVVYFRSSHDSAAFAQVERTDIA